MPINNVIIDLLLDYLPFNKLLLLSSTCINFRLQVKKFCSVKTNNSFLNYKRHKTCKEYKEYIFINCYRCNKSIDRRRAGLCTVENCQRYFCDVCGGLGICYNKHCKHCMDEGKCIGCLY
jgi:hypothetical protein